MKKKTGSILLSCTMALVCALFSGCGFFSDREGLEYESDGLFHYYGGEKSYIIIGEEENLPEMVYVPSHYQGKEIVSYNTRYTPPSTIGGGHERYYHLYLDDVKRVYFPYNCDADYFDWSQPIGSKSLTQQFYIGQGFNMIYFINIMQKLYYISSAEEKIDRELYSNQILYNKLIAEIEEIENENDYSFKVEGNKITIKVLPSILNSPNDYIFRFFIRIANTSYLFNYEGEPNDGYFFINNFEYGGKIENTPYEPMREGYTFGGWYKEPECINAWNFDEDKLPEAKQDEEGNAEFVETKLYAKWVPA